MRSIVNTLYVKRAFSAKKAATPEQIAEAEQKLCLKFSVEYREYLSTCGTASIQGHELTGICDSNRLNVVYVTIMERAMNPDASLNWYVIEEANIDGIVIWQAEDGTVYQTIPNELPVKLCDSLCDYIDL